MNTLSRSACVLLLTPMGAFGAPPIADMTLPSQPSVEPSEAGARVLALLYPLVEQYRESHGPDRTETLREIIAICVDAHFEGVTGLSRFTMQMANDLYAIPGREAAAEQVFDLLSKKADRPSIAARAHDRLGRIRANRGEWADAEIAFRDALRVRATDSTTIGSAGWTDTMTYLAYVLSMDGRFAEAVAEREKILARPDHAARGDDLLFLFLENGRDSAKAGLPGAAEWYDRAFREFPKSGVPEGNRVAWEVERLDASGLISGTRQYTDALTAIWRSEGPPSAIKVATGRNLAIMLEREQRRVAAAEAIYAQVEMMALALETRALDAFDRELLNEEIAETSMRLAQKAIREGRTDDARTRLRSLVQRRPHAGVLDWASRTLAELDAK